MRRILRAIVIGLVLGGIVFWWIRRNAEVSRIEEVRRRVGPRLKAELRAAGLALGDEAFIRIFKETRELEVWLKPRAESRFQFWKTFGIAAMSGRLGPKLAEGDAQAPEGFYEVTANAVNPNSAFHLSFNIGYPNAFDVANNRTGSFIMVHGGEASVGCFAMTDAVVEEIYLLAEAALMNGQQSLPVHVFPFRMSDERMSAAAASEWRLFWESLRAGYESFEQTHVPPDMRVTDGGYVIGKSSG